MRAFLRASTMYQHCCYNNDVQMLLLLAAVRIRFCVMLFLFAVSVLCCCFRLFVLQPRILLFLQCSALGIWLLFVPRQVLGCFSVSYIRAALPVRCCLHYVLCTTLAHICYIRIRPRSEIPPAAAYISCVPRGTTASASCLLVFLSCCISTYHRTHPLIPSL